MDLVEKLHEVFDVFEHLYLAQPFRPVVQSHAKVLVNLSSVHCHLARSIFEDALVFLLESIDQFVIDQWVLVAQLAVVHMPADRLLVSIDEPVGHTWIVWIDLESTPCQCLSELLVVEQTCDHGAVDYVQAPQDKHLGAFLVLGDVAAVDFWSYLQ